jgi:membrane protein required for colicin V production
MIWVDYGILGVLAVSALIGVFRGFTKEALSLLTWVLAFWISITFAPWAAGELAPWIPVPSVRIATAYGSLFLVSLIVGSIVNHLVSKLVKASPFAGPDRTLGVFFGLARGVVLVILFVLVAGLTPVKQDPWWQQSFLIARFQWAADQVRPFVPPEWIAPLQPEAPAETAQKS